MPEPRSEVIEDRTRVIVALPACFDAARLTVTNPTRQRNINLDKAAARVLRGIRRFRARGVGFTGYTISQNNAFLGYWLPAGRRKLVQDDIRLLIIDFAAPLTSTKMRRLLQEIRLLTVQSYYFGPDEFQDDVWVVAHSLVRQLQSDEEACWLAAKHGGIQTLPANQGGEAIP